MSSVLAQVRDYYSAKVAAHGPSAQGVDWRDEASQEARFEQLAKILVGGDAASICDLGCGYGAFAQFLRRRGWIGRYEGVDVSEEMIKEARKVLATDPCCQLTVGDRPIQKSDFVVASGIFNVKLEVSYATWCEHVFSMIDLMVETAEHGVAFNCLTSWADTDKMQKHLYYARPEQILAYCAEKYSRWVELSHDYGLFEFTIRMRFDRSFPNRRTS